MNDISLMNWFEASLPPRSTVIWPDALGTCGEQEKTGEQTSSMQCAEIHFNDIERNSGTVYIAMTTDSENRPGEVSFHSSVYSWGDASQSVESLTDLGKLLSAGTK